VSGMNRREFAEAIAVAALAPLVTTGASPSGWTGSLGAGAVAGASAYEPNALAKALVGAIRAQYGDRLTEADLSTVTRQIETGLQRADKIRKVPLANGDEPDFVFSAIRSESAV
jgi:hypothetical protein